jgi:hypothetical protein
MHEILNNLLKLNTALQACLTKNNVEFIPTMDLLTGEPGCRMDVIMNTLINCWNSDRIPIVKKAMGLLNRFSWPLPAMETENSREGSSSRKRVTTPLLCRGTLWLH